MSIVCNTYDVLQTTTASIFDEIRTLCIFTRKMSLQSAGEKKTKKDYKKRWLLISLLYFFYFSLNGNCPIFWQTVKFIIIVICYMFICKKFDEKLFILSCCTLHFLKRLFSKPPIEKGVKLFGLGNVVFQYKVSDIWLTHSSHL